MTGEKFVFTASRLTAGNALFPARLEITPERITRVKPRLIGSEEESVPITKVASVNIRIGLFWADISIDSTGGNAPMVSRGHSKADARAVRDLIERFQRGGQAGS